MTHYVPDWDDRGHGLTAFEDTNLHHTGKEGAHQRQHQLHHSYHQLHLKHPASALVPSHDVLDILTDTGMQENEGIHSTDRLGCSSIPALDMPVEMNNTHVHEDEMISWLRYPLEDSFDRDYCSEMFGELVNPHVQLVKDVFVHQTMKEPASAHMLNIRANVGSEVGLQQPTSTGNTTGSPREAFKTDAALAMGAGRAAGLLPQSGLEAFNGVRTHLNPCALLKSSSSPCEKSTSDGKNAVQTLDPVSTTPTVTSGFNFSVFSRPVATALDSLRLVGAVSGPTNVERARQPHVKDSQLPCGRPSTGDSNRSIVVSMPSSQQSAEFASEETSEKLGAVCQGWHSPMSLPCGSVVHGHNKAAELNNHASCVSVSENAIEKTEAIENTVSPSCLSGCSSEKVAHDVLIPSPKKASSSAQYSELQDVDDAAANAKRPPPGPRAVKRSRAAEVHNESEKKRRNKINVRLKALQSLIPNSNKTDKASVLDEAIEYTKMLQAQVQFMSVKSGMFFPTTMSAGMHYVPMQQIPTFPHLGMGMSMGLDMGFGMHVTETNAAASTVGVGVTAATGAGTGATLNLSPISHQQALSSHTYEGSRLLQTSSFPLNQDISGCLPTACSSEPYKVMSQQSLQCS